MDRQKILKTVREKFGKGISSESNDNEISQDDMKNSDESQSARESAKMSGRKPQSRNEGRVSSIGRNVAEQLRGKK